ncbi:MAG: HAMP domain-containing histidine kinase [Clostridiales Family XIII bacterium]|jgi:signal transduction histidine kinase|nr:HAMP domain-containing histidine kinase [Clostridiales Family XIII bacterium]
MSALGVRRKRPRARLPKLRSSTGLALFFAAAMVVTLLSLYALMSSGVSGGFVAVVPLSVAFLSFVMTSMAIDRLMNPIRQMTDKLRLMGDGDYDAKIFIDSAEDELREYARAFNGMSARVSEHIEKQRRFVSDASHELTTPLAVIAGHADMLRRWGRDDPALLSAGLDAIHSEAVSMGALVDDLLFFARADDGRLQYSVETVDLSALIAGCADERAALSPDFDISLDIEPRVLVSADRAALQRALRAILDNAVKYSADRKSVSISLKTVAGPGAPRAEAAISDSGVGIDERHLDRIFDRFYRVDDSRSKAGSGLGLAIAKEIVAAHGGAISVSSRLGEGTAFTILLDVATDVS